MPEALRYLQKQIELSHDSCLYDCKKSTTKGVKITGKVYIDQQIFIINESGCAANSDKMISVADVGGSSVT
eukprot:SAG11_NODE_2777_length_2982_cov_719.588970_1_plen_70_part_10